MAYEVVPTESFEYEYESVIRYHVEALSNLTAAKSLMVELDKVRVELSHNPMLHAVSRKSNLMQRELRERLIKNYVLVYRIDGDFVYLVHLFHQSQDFEHIVH